MPNQIENIMPRVVARGLLALRQQAILPRLVNSDFSAEAAKKGSVIEVPISQAIEAEPVEPSAQQPQPPDTQMHTVQIHLDNWQKASFYLTDKEMDHIEAHENFVPLQMAEAIHALARAVNQSILYYLNDGPAFVGTFGTDILHPPRDPANPTRDEGFAPIVDARRLLNQVGAAKSNRYMLLNYDTEAAFLSNAGVMDASKSGDTGPAREGEIGRRFGFDFFSMDQVRRFKEDAYKGTTSASISKGSKQAFIRDNGRDIFPGRLYLGELPEALEVISANRVNSTTTNVKFAAGPTATISSGTTAYYNGGPSNGIAFHRDAVALAMRPLAPTGMVAGHNGQMMSITDPETGLSLRLEVTRQYKQTVWEFDILWGAALVRPELTIKLAGV